jgi:hypothetical protein
LQFSPKPTHQTAFELIQRGAFCSPYGRGCSVRAFGSTCAPQEPSSLRRTHPLRPSWLSPDAVDRGIAVFGEPLPSVSRRKSQPAVLFPIPTLYGRPLLLHALQSRERGCAKLCASFSGGELDQNFGTRRQEKRSAPVPCIPLPTAFEQPGQSRRCVAVQRNTALTGSGLAPPGSK